MKVLLSKGYGAGWSSWAENKNKEIATYQPIIDFLEKGGDPSDIKKNGLIKKMIEELELDCFYSDGAEQLTVEEIPDGPFRVIDYDGSESVEFPDPGFWW